jgi:predicted DNA-binding antitoxin AbrB/MazE fold protein
MGTVHAIFDGGIFRPLEPVALPDQCRVAFEPRVVENGEADDGMDAIYEIMERRYNSGVTDTAARHNEHQP